jgi:ribosomal protein S12 methylthiotransferase
MKKAKPTINFISLGCAKNLVDSEHLARQLTLAGWEVCFDAEGPADVAIVNTCGFIADAKEESIDTILALTEARQRGDYQKVIAFGCLTQRYAEDLKGEIPEVDHYFGVNDHAAILEALQSEYRCGAAHERNITTPAHYAYLKISEGCNRQCSFCIIPSIRGKHISVPVDDLVREATWLSRQGVKELLLVAQDLSSYGSDLKDPEALTRLLHALEEISGIEWIRLHYAYPTGFPKQLIKLMASSRKIVPYLDIPFQHASDHILRSMRRGHNQEEMQSLIDQLRNEIPGLALRTTLIVGYPGETQSDFEQLIRFVQQNRFERLGVFTYSEEEGTHAATLPDDVPEALKTARVSEIMAIQQEISQEINHRKIGTTIKVLVDRIEEEFAVGRSLHDSPEVDNEVMIANPGNITPGTFVDVMIRDAEPFELYGIMASSPECLDQPKVANTSPKPS